MLINRRFLDGIKNGTVTLQFRKWKRPTVKTGGTLRTRIGVLAIDSVDQIEESSILQGDARRAGFDSREELMDSICKFREGNLYRIELSYSGEDPRISLRNKKELTPDEFESVRSRLVSMDQRSSIGPWTRKAMKLIGTWPARRAPELAELFGVDTKRFKTNVRKLKELGLTESLAVGYRLSPRGKTVCRKLGLMPRRSK
ncbi:MAG: ASCH domain-containing protein [Planctomycetota bacterium]